MIACLDAAYSDAASAAACILAADWDAAAPVHETAIRAGAPAPYEPGAFYRRELPLLLAVLKAAPLKPTAIVIDGYAWLDAAGRRGLGTYLFEAVACPVVGIGKTEFDGATNWAQCVTRGASASPLYITAAGMDASLAADAVRRMHGAARLPTLVRAADRVAREALRR